MIDYATWCAIRDGVAQHLTAPQLAQDLGLDVKTVRHWIGRPYTPRAPVKRASKLDPFKGRIVGWLDAHPLTAQQVFLRLRDAGYSGGISIVKDYVQQVRPRRREAFLTLAFAPGEVAQADWGECGTIAVGNTRRRLSFFVMVLDEAATRRSRLMLRHELFCTSVSLFRGDDCAIFREDKPA